MRTISRHPAPGRHPVALAGEKGKDWMGGNCCRTGHKTCHLLLLRNLEEEKEEGEEEEEEEEEEEG